MTPNFGAGALQAVEPHADAFVDEEALEGAAVEHLVPEPGAFGAVGRGGDEEGDGVRDGALVVFVDERTGIDALAGDGGDGLFEGVAPGGAAVDQRVVEVEDDGPRHGAVIGEAGHGLDREPEPLTGGGVVVGGVQVELDHLVGGDFDDFAGVRFEDAAEALAVVGGG